MDFWTEEDSILLEKADSYSDLFRVAEKVLRRMPPPVFQVCGPVSTGGLGSIEKNLEEIEKMIKKLQGEKKSVFNQIPLEAHIQRIKAKRDFKGYDESILSDLYLPLFESGLIHSLCFLPDWKSSTGAKWEHEQAERLGLGIIYLEKIG